MAPLRFLSKIEQLAAHLRAELVGGRWERAMPGRLELAAELHNGLDVIGESVWNNALGTVGFGSQIQIKMNPLAELNEMAAGINIFFFYDYPIYKTRFRGLNRRVN